MVIEKSEDWIDHRQDREKIWGLVSVIINFRFQQIAGICWLGKGLSAFQLVLCSTVLFCLFVCFVLLNYYHNLMKNLFCSCMLNTPFVGKNSLGYCSCLWLWKCVYTFRSVCFKTDFLKLQNWRFLSGNPLTKYYRTISAHTPRFIYHPQCTRNNLSCKISFLYTSLMVEMNRQLP
jgi:hypothetical protein